MNTYGKFNWVNMKLKTATFFLLLAIATTGCSTDSSNCAGTIGVGSPVQQMNISLANGAVQRDVFDPPAIFTRDVFIEGFSLAISEESGGTIANVRVLENATTGEIQVFEIIPLATGETQVTLTASNTCDEEFNTTDTFTLTVTQ